MKQKWFYIADASLLDVRYPFSIQRSLDWTKLWET